MSAKLQLDNSMGETQYYSRVTQVIRETPRTVSLQIKLSGLSDISYKPGQYVHLTLEIDGVVYTRYYSISTFSGTEGSIRITIQKVELGVVSNWLFENAFVGMYCWVTQPMGEFYLDENHLEHPLALFGAGSGVTPLLPMLQNLNKAAFKKPLHIFLSFSTPEDFIFQREFTMLAQQLEKSHLHVNFTQRPADHDGETCRLKQQAIQHHCPDISAFKAFICGSGGYVADMTSHLQSLNLSQHDILTEHFSLVHPNEEALASGIQVQLDAEVLCDNAKGDKTILELAEEAGAYITSVCRNGLCGACMVRIEGNTHGGCTEALDPESIEQGIRLACCTYPLGDCSVFSDTSLS